MNQSDDLMVARALRIALGYESREDRINQLEHSTDPGIRFLIQRLKAQGLIEAASVRTPTFTQDLTSRFK